MAKVFPNEDFSKMGGFATFMRLDEKENDIGDLITLPLPQNLVYSDRASYENADIGVIGATIKDNGEGEGPLSKARSVLDKLSIGDGKGLALDVTSRILGNRTRFLSGRTPNPNTRALFKQMNLREFSFAYKFLPVNKTEAENVKEIIKEFRLGMHPDTTDSVKIGQNQSVNATYIMPDRFRIEFYLGLGAGQKLVEPELQPCYLSTLNLSYNNSQTAILHDGKGSPQFSEVDLSITFTEHMTNTKDNIEAGF